MGVRALSEPDAPRP